MKEEKKGREPEGKKSDRKDILSLFDIGDVYLPKTQWRAQRQNEFQFQLKPQVRLSVVTDPPGWKNRVVLVGVSEDKDLKRSTGMAREGGVGRG